MEEITWYQCSDRPNFYSKNKHQSYKDDGSFALDRVLANSENVGDLLKVCGCEKRGGTQGIFIIIKGGTLLPYPLVIDACENE